MTNVGFHPTLALEALLSTLDASALQRDLRRLCDPDFGGRRLGTDGHERAAAWLSARMDQLWLARVAILSIFDTIAQAHRRKQLC